MNVAISMEVQRSSQDEFIDNPSAVVFDTFSKQVRPQFPSNAIRCSAQGRRPGLFHRGSFQSSWRGLATCSTCFSRRGVAIPAGMAWNGLVLEPRARVHPFTARALSTARCEERHQHMRQSRTTPRRRLRRLRKPSRRPIRRTPSRPDAGAGRRIPADPSQTRKIDPQRGLPGPDGRGAGRYRQVEDGRRPGP